MFSNEYKRIKLDKQFPEDMSQEKAKELSVAKWEFIVNEISQGRDVYYDGGNSTCALCFLYNKKETSLQDVCEGCPINKKGNYYLCNRTPFMRVTQDLKKNGCLKLTHARKELAFLKSL